MAPGLWVWLITTLENELPLLILQFLYELKSRNEAKASSNFKAVNSWNTKFGKLLLFNLIIFQFY